MTGDLTAGPVTGVEGRDRFATGPEGLAAELATSVPSNETAAGTRSSTGPSLVPGVGDDDRMQALDRLIDDGSRLVKHAVQAWPLASVGVAVLVGMLVGRR